MAQKNRFNHHKRARPASDNRGPVVREAPAVYVKAPPVQYGKAFIVMEDREKNTFEYSAGAWVPFSMNMVACRQSCQVKELPQKLNGMTRYEVRLPLTEQA